MPSAIETRGLTKDFGNGRGILGLDLDVRQGEVFGFLGPNGSGKTTTIRLLLDLLRPTSGEARILGRDVRRDGIEVRRRVGYLPGELALYPTMRGRRLVERVQGLRGDVDPARVEALATRLGAELDRRIGELSSGNRQKVGLVLAFMHEPEVLILDEPVTGLDPLMQKEVQAMVLEARDAGATVFLSSHNLPEVERLCDRIAIVRDGRLLAVHRLAELRRRRVHRLVFRFDGEAPRHAFDGLPGVERLEGRGHELRITVAGPVDPVLKAAARHTVLDVESQDPDLEETFLAYYRSDPHA